ncbi:MAG: DUF6089 family protein [Ferruginibacter sp.]
MKYIHLFLLIVIPFTGSSQKLHADLFMGIANYQGDLQGKRFTLSQSKPVIGLGASYDLTNKFIARAGFFYGKIEGNDSKNKNGKGIELRNLNFSSTITEFNVGLEYNFFDLGYHDISPYVFAGAAVYHFNPYTKDAAGNKIFLKPLSTEGQGLPQYPDRKPYKLTQFAIPFSGGLKFALSENLQVGLEIGFRKLFTDYLDDVSMNYVDSATLYAERGAQAVNLAYRGDEVAGGPSYPADGAQRGNPKFKDWYYFSVVRVSYRLNNRKSNKNGLGCPGRLY